MPMKKGRTYIRIVNPAIKREGYPPRSLTMRDTVMVPITYCRRSWPLMDMLSDNSIRNLIAAYNSIGGKV